MEKIGFVGVGRMGANMARRLKEQGFAVVAVHDINPEAARALAQELGAEACADLKQVTRLSDVIITVVTDDKSMKEIYLGGLLARSRGKLFINCATLSPAIHVWVEQKAENGRAIARGLHGLQHHAGARRHALPDVRRIGGGVQPRQTGA
jgi:3-hydroxyisobutyrate dehydrogenase